MPDTPRKKEADQDMPSIPDGGLSQSMPDWLRRPPAWRTLPDREVVFREPTATSTLPEADTSEIDPRTFIQDDDLPEWLRTLRKPTAVVDNDPGQAPPSGMSPNPVHQSKVTFGDALTPAGFRPRRPPVRDVASIRHAPIARVRRREVDIARPWWERAAFTASLGAALLIAIIVIIVLVIA